MTNQAADARFRRLRTFQLGEGVASKRPSIQPRLRMIGQSDHSRIAAPCGFVVAFLTCACSPDQQYLSIKQVAKGPDGLLTAAYVEDTSGGAAVGTGFDVYIFEGERPKSYSDRVFSDECVTDVRVSWVGPRELRISYGAREGHRATASPGPWWDFGRTFSHGVMIRLVPHVSHNPYLC